VREAASRGVSRHASRVQDPRGLLAGAAAPAGSPARTPGPAACQSELRSTSPTSALPSTISTTPPLEVGATHNTSMASTLPSLTRSVYKMCSDPAARVAVLAFPLACRLIRRQSSSMPDADVPTGLSPEKQADVLIELWRGARARVDQRRALEWKLSFGLWGAFTAFVALTLRQDAGTSLTGLRWWVLAFGVAATGLHFFYLFLHVLPRNKLDRGSAIKYEATLLAGCFPAGRSREQATTRRDHNAEQNRLSDQVAGPSYPSLIFQVGITLLLSIAAFLISG
jgi:hypothetical protein